MDSALKHSLCLKHQQLTTKAFYHSVFYWTTGYLFHLRMTVWTLTLGRTTSAMADQVPASTVATKSKVLNLAFLLRTCCSSCTTLSFTESPSVCTLQEIYGTKMMLWAYTLKKDINWRNKIIIVEHPSHNLYASTEKAAMVSMGKKAFSLESCG